MSSLHTERLALQTKLNTLLSILGKEHVFLQHRIRETQRRLSDLRFHVAVVGEYSTGKSSFLNAMLQDEILPTALEECTAVVTRIRHADVETPMIETMDQTGQKKSIQMDALSTALTFSEAQEQELAEVIISLPLQGEFEKQVDFIDTPGVNDSSMRGDAITLKWLPQADAIVFLTHCMQAFKKSEIDFLSNHVAKQDISRFLFIVSL